MSLMKAERTLRWSDGSPPNADRVVPPAKHTHTHTTVTHTHSNLVAKDPAACSDSIRHLGLCLNTHLAPKDTIFRVTSMPGDAAIHFEGMHAGEWIVLLVVIVCLDSSCLILVLRLFNFHLRSVSGHSLCMVRVCSSGREIRDHKGGDKRTEIG